MVVIVMKNLKGDNDNMKTSLQDLNMYLFEELERLNDSEELENEENLEKEIKRSKAITNVAQTIINNANTVLDAQKFMSDSGVQELPKMLLGNSEK